MLPFDNKSELQVVIDMPEGTTLEQTARVGTEIGRYLRTVPEVTDWQLYAGAASPYNFNGLVRHYFLRSAPHEADLQVNLVPKGERKAQSHEIAKRHAPAIDAIGRRYGARVKIAEIPPGPPVLSTLVAEVYGPDPRAGARSRRGPRHLRGDARRRRRRLVRRGRPAQGDARRGPREGRAQRHLRRAGLADARGGARRPRRRAGPPAAREGAGRAARAPAGGRPHRRRVARRRHGPVAAGRAGAARRPGRGAPRRRGEDDLPQEPAAGGLRRRRRRRARREPGLRDPRR